MFVKCLQVCRHWDQWGGRKRVFSIVMTYENPGRQILMGPVISGWPGRRSSEWALRHFDVTSTVHQSTLTTSWQLPGLGLDPVQTLGLVPRYYAALAQTLQPVCWLSEILRPSGEWSTSFYLTREASYSLGSLRKLRAVRRYLKRAIREVLSYSLSPVIPVSACRPHVSLSAGCNTNWLQGGQMTSQCHPWPGSDLSRSPTARSVKYPDWDVSLAFIAGTRPLITSLAKPALKPKTKGFHIWPQAASGILQLTLLSPSLSVQVSNWNISPEIFAPGLWTDRDDPCFVL